MNRAYGLRALFATGAVLAALVTEAAGPAGRYETPVAKGNVTGGEAKDLLDYSLVAVGQWPKMPEEYRFGVSDEAGERISVCEFAEPVAFGCLHYHPIAQI